VFFLKKSNNNIERFVEAQKSTYDNALKEVKQGCKRSHWMWYIFPQVSGLGQTSKAKYYSIKSKEEAEEYIKNPTLKSNLLEISNALLGLKTDNVMEIFNFPDDLKLKSSMTLFSIIAPEHDVFEKVLDKYFNGEKDKFTIDFLKK
jgi:uncharacterized protein (DUF1810 family)